MCKNERNKVAKAEIIAGLEEEITNEVKMRISVCDEFKNGLKQITGMLNRGYSMSHRQNYAVGYIYQHQRFH